MPEGEETGGAELSSVELRHTLARNVKGTLVTTLLAASLVAFAGCGGGGGDKTFEGDGYSFTYPGEWKEREGGEAAAEVGEPVSEAFFGPSEGPDGLTVQVFRVNLSITEGNIDELSGDIAEFIGELFRQGDGRVTSGPTPVTLGGLPGRAFEGSFINKGGTRVQTRLTLAFDGRTEYFLSCEFTPEGAEEMKRGCEQVEESFQVE